MNTNPGDPFKHHRWQRKCYVGEQRPISVDYAYILRSEEVQEAKKKNAKSATTNWPRLWIPGATLLALSLALGILYFHTGVNPWRRSSTEKQLGGFAALYREYGTVFGKPPTNIQALKTWAEKLDKQKLAHFEIDDVDTLFVSDRDGQPFVLIPLPRGLGPVLAHEMFGAHGTRFVISSEGRVEELDETRFQQAMETNRMIAMGPKGH